MSMSSCSRSSASSNPSMAPTIASAVISSGGGSSESSRARNTHNSSRGKELLPTLTPAPHNKNPTNVQPPAVSAGPDKGSKGHQSPARECNSNESYSKQEGNGSGMTWAPDGHIFGGAWTWPLGPDGFGGPCLLDDPARWSTVPHYQQPLPSPGGYLNHNKVGDIIGTTHLNNQTQQNIKKQDENRRREDGSRVVNKCMQIMEATEKLTDEEKTYAIEVLNWLKNRISQVNILTEGASPLPARALPLLVERFGDGDGDGLRVTVPLRGQVDPLGHSQRQSQRRDATRRKQNPRDASSTPPAHSEATRPLASSSPL